MKGIDNRWSEVFAGGLGRHLRRGIRGRAGFTLIELLVVIIIIAILATIAIPTFLGQRQNAQDAAAYTLVRNALTAMQGALVDTGDYRLVTVDHLATIEPGIVWIESDEDLVATDPAWIADPVPAATDDNEVAFYLESKTQADLASVSASGNSFGIQIDTVNIAETGYVKVKVIEGITILGW